MGYGHRPPPPSTTTRVSEHAHEDEAGLCPPSFASGWAASPLAAGHARPHWSASARARPAFGGGLTAYSLLQKSLWFFSACLFRSTIAAGARSFRAGRDAWRPQFVT